MVDQSQVIIGSTSTNGRSKVQHHWLKKSTLKEVNYKRSQLQKKSTLKKSTLNKSTLKKSTLNKPILKKSTLNKSTLNKSTENKSTLMHLQTFLKNFSRQWQVMVSTQVTQLRVFSEEELAIPVDAIRLLTPDRRRSAVGINNPIARLYHRLVLVSDDDALSGLSSLLQSTQFNKVRPRFQTAYCMYVSSKVRVENLHLDGQGRGQK